MNFVDRSDYSSDEFQMVVQVYDKYFGRTESRARLSLSVVGTGVDLLITAMVPEVEKAYY